MCVFVCVYLTAYVRSFDREPYDLSRESLNELSRSREGGVKMKSRYRYSWMDEGLIR